MKLKGIIFDGDGVLFNTEQLHVIAWKKILPFYNINLNSEDFNEGVGVEDAEFLKKLLIKGKISKNIKIEEIVREKNDELIKILNNENLENNNEIIEILKFLRNKYKIALASNSEKKFVYKVVEKLKIAEYFDLIITKNDVKNPKPHPDIYLLTLKLLNIPCENLIAFEDSETGISSAKKTGIFCVAVATTSPVEKLKMADIIINELTLKNVKSIIRIFEKKYED
ncbi:MAG: HAD family phosphatase [Candidatus Omnitrophica bacterium]|nr:HAD family phosphatase [Candidatus Omnitrophota bacterium]